MIHYLLSLILWSFNIVEEGPPTKQLKQSPSGEKQNDSSKLVKKHLFSRGEIIVQTILFVDLNQNHTIAFIDIFESNTK